MTWKPGTHIDVNRETLRVLDSMAATQLWHMSRSQQVRHLAEFYMRHWLDNYPALKVAAGEELDQPGAGGHNE